MPNKNNVMTAEERQALLDGVRNESRPWRDESLVRIKAFANDLQTEKFALPLLLQGGQAEIIAALYDFCEQANKSHDYLKADALAALTEKDIKGSKKRALERLNLTADAAILVERVIEEIKKPDMRLDIINERLKLIEKRATQLDDPDIIARRKLARGLLVAGIALLVLGMAVAMTSLAVLSVVAAPLAIPLFAGLLAAGIAMLAAGSISIGVSTAMPGQSSYQPTRLSHTLHFFRDVTKDALAGKSTPGIRNTIHQICRNAR